MAMETSSLLALICSVLDQLLIFPLPWPFCTLLFLLVLSFFFLTKKQNPIYLVDYVCSTPPAWLRVPPSLFLEHSTLLGRFTNQSLEFQKIILDRSGLGEETALPHGLWHLPPRPTLSNARHEAEMVLFPPIKNVITSTGLHPSDINILIVNCSLFSPTPSLCGLIINKFNLSSDVKSYQLSGMGCSAGVISLSLAQKMLKVRSNSYALVVTTENITENWYMGNRRSMVVSNCLFRMGGCAIILSNKSSDAHRSKYRLKHVVRTITCGGNEKSYRAAFQEQDDEANVGVTLSKELTKVAGHALYNNMSQLGPLVLPLSEQMGYLFSFLVGKFNKSNKKIKPHIPDFKKAFDHFCIHAGGRAIIDELQKALQLKSEHVEASRMALYRFGNTSSSSIWYELAYLEAKERVKPGHVIWQIALGSGFKCNSAVWVALPQMAKETNHFNNPWKDCIHEYPVDISAPLH